MSQSDDTDNRRDVRSTNAYLAMGLLADATGPDTYHGQDVDEARKHLRRGLEAGASDTDAGRRIERALEYLADMEEYAPDERRLKVRDALAELAPTVAGVTDKRPGEGPYAVPEDTKPSIPVFYHIPGAVADRAIERFQTRRESAPAPQHRTHLADYIHDEIDEWPVMYVGGAPLSEYAAGRVKSMVIEPDAEE